MKKIVVQVCLLIVVFVVTGCKYTPAIEEVISDFNEGGSYKIYETIKINGGEFAISATDDQKKEDIALYTMVGDDFEGVSMELYFQQKEEAIYYIDYYNELKEEQFSYLERSNQTHKYISGVVVGEYSTVTYPEGDLLSKQVSVKLKNSYNVTFWVLMMDINYTFDYDEMDFEK